MLSDLFEVVDRRAKLVVGDKPDEEINPLLPGIFYLCVCVIPVALEVINSI